jgi:hypothetical protein
MTTEANAKDLSSAFLRMSRPASKGGSGGTFTTAATKAGHEDSPEGRKSFARRVVANPGNYSDKMRRKAQFYLNVISK